MKRFKVTCKGQILSEDAKVALSLYDRVVGLMFKKEMNGFDGLFIRPCRSIHTFFMRYPIDVLFLNKNNEIVKIFKSLKPWRMTRLYFTAYEVFELPSGVVKGDIVAGDRINIECIN